MTLYSEEDLIKRIKQLEKELADRTRERDTFLVEWDKEIEDCKFLHSKIEGLEKKLADLKANSILITKRERGIPNPILDEAEVKRTLTPDPTAPGLMKEEWEEKP